jgi:cold shock CspA family protein/ribosome-associated translation inhibitor RaiA
MQIAPKVVLKDVPAGAALEERIRKEVEDLETFWDRITTCRVVVEPASKRRQTGNLYRVKVDLVVPDREIVVSHDPPQDQTHEDPHVAVRDAFRAVRRRLEDYARERRSAVKVHPTPTFGEVIRLEREEGFGFLRARDGHELYFHRNSVITGDYDDLQPGCWVEYVEEAGEEGAQAARLQVVKGLRPPPEAEDGHGG